MTQYDCDALRGLRLLIVEDEPLIAMALAEECERAGALVVGPAASVAAAIDLVDREAVDAAILDIELRQERVCRVADLLNERDVPFAFTTGHDAGVLPRRHAGRPVCLKPAPAIDVLRILAAVIARR